MNASGAAIDLAPTLRLLLLAGGIALLPLAWVWLRSRRGDARTRLAALTALTLFLTFDLIVFGAFTRLSDAGLGCPDWPGCYGEASPLAAHDDISAAASAQPSGPVTPRKAWIEMVHRYLAMVVGALILVLTAASWAGRRQLPHSWWWPAATLAWVIVQGAFGKFTVTLKLYPLIVTLHLLGGMVLLALLAIQREAYLDRPLALPEGLRRGVKAVLVLLTAQIALGGWVSTNYAVLACQGFPQCNGQWWPTMDFEHGFTLLRELGRAGHGGFLPAEALVAIHWVHRGFALVLAIALLVLVRALWRQPGPAARRFAKTLLALLALQLASGLGNVVLQWPLVAALAHTAGAAGLVLVSVSLAARCRRPASSSALAGRTALLA
ncbi:MAG TPA: COX15/CtaA family protein [Ideonella sp.]|nr:COX15/CtaA family protein [Ideonella sp.]